MSQPLRSEIEIPGLITSVEAKPAEILLSSNFIAIPLHGDLADCLRYLTERSSEFLAHPQKLVILNCVYATFNKAGFPGSGIVQQLSAIRALCLKQGKRFVLVQCPAELKTELAAAWKTEDVFFANLSQALCVLGSTLVDMKDELKLLEKAVIEVFDSQFGIALSAKPPQRLDPHVAGPIQAEVIGLMPLSSEGAQGNLAICFQGSTLRQLSRMAFGNAVPESDPETFLIAAELINMVLGCAKTELNEKGYGIEQALPQTFTANANGVVTANLFRPSWAIEFQSKLGNFYLEVSMKALEA